MNPELQPETKRLLEQGNDLMKRFNEQNKNTGVITAESLNTATTPLKLPNQPTQNASSNLAATTTSVAQSAKNQLQADLETETAPLKKESASLKDRIFGTLTDIGGQEAERQRLLEKEGANKLRSEVNSLTSLMEQKDLATRRAIERVEENKAGLFGGAVQDEVKRLERENAREQADLAITLAAKTRQFDTISSIIEDKVKAETEALKTNLEAYKFFYQENKDQLNSKEKAILESRIREEERTYTETRDLSKAKAELQARIAEVGAPLGVIQAVSNATSLEEAYKAAGRYGGGIDFALKQAQLQKAYQDLQTGPKKTDTQLKASGFAQRMIEAGQIVDSIGSKFAGVESYAGQVLPNILKSEDRQKFEQAQRNFINAVLRRESGAVISEEEFANARKQYFPQPGDSVGVLEQKRQNRLTSTNSLLNESGVEQIPYIPETEQTRVVNGQTYIKVEGGWKLQK